MKQRVPALSLAVILPLAAGALAWADDVLPQAAPADRYARMADRSPFAPPTVALAVPSATPVPAGPKWSDDLAVTLLTQQGGVFFATIQNKSNNERFLLQSDREDLERHLALASVEWGQLSAQTSVMLRHDTEFAAVHFDASAPPVSPAGNSLPPGRGFPPGNYPASAGTPAPGHLQPPPNPTTPDGAPRVARRASVIRSTPTVAAPPSRPATPLPLRALSNQPADEP